MDSILQFNPLRKLDFSQELEIHKTKDGKIFAIKNRRLDTVNGKLIVDIAGDEDAAKQYLKDWADSLTKYFQPDVDTSVSARP